MNLVDKVIDSKVTPIALEVLTPLGIYFACSVADSLLGEGPIKETIRNPFTLVKAGAYCTMLGVYASRFKSYINKK